MEGLDDCLLADVVVAQDMGDSMHTLAEEVDRKPRKVGTEVTRRCAGCQAVCALVEVPGHAPKYVGLAEEALKIACPDYNLDDIA